MIRFENLSVTKSKKPILHDLSFSVKQGEITALLGKNGSGKSTLLSCVNGLCPYGGNIFLNGTDLASLSARERATRVAIFPQLLPNTPLTVKELTALGRTPYTGFTGRLSDADEEAIAKALATAGAEALSHRPCNTLSGGERQRAFLAMLLAQDTPLLLLDEPATFLDADAARSLCELLRTLTRDHGKTVLAVIHDLSAAVRLADRIVILENGTPAFVGTTEECLAARAIENAFSVTAHRADGRVFFA